MNNVRYCTELESYDSGGGFVLTEMPFNYKGKDCFLCLSHENDLVLFNNIYDEPIDSPYYEENIVKEISRFDRIPIEFRESAKKLMKCKQEYISITRHTDYKEYCKKNMKSNEIKYYKDLFDE